MLRQIRNTSMTRSVGLVLFLVAVLLLLRNRQSSSSLLKKEILSMSQVFEEMPSGTEEMNDDNQHPIIKNANSKEPGSDKVSFGVNNENEIAKMTSEENYKNGIEPANYQEQDNHKSLSGEVNNENVKAKMTSEENHINAIEPVNSQEHDNNYLFDEMKKEIEITDMFSVENQIYGTENTKEQEYDNSWSEENNSERERVNMTKNLIKSSGYSQEQDNKSKSEEVNNEREITNMMSVENEIEGSETENTTEQESWSGEMNSVREITNMMSDENQITSKEGVTVNSGHVINEKAQMENVRYISHEKDENKPNISSVEIQSLVPMNTMQDLPANPLNPNFSAHQILPLYKTQNEGMSQIVNNKTIQITPTSPFEQNSEGLQILPLRLLESFQTQINTTEQIQAFTQSTTEFLQGCKSTELKTIGWYQGKNVQDFSGTEMFEDCEYSCCTLEKVKVNKQEVDVLVFEAKILHDIDLPPRLSPDQAWVFYSMEPDVRRLKNVSAAWNDAFNWTMTYREDSDIYMPYMTVEKDMKPVVRDYGQIISMKDKKSIWIENRCKLHSNSKAFDYVTILKRYIDVDIFGMYCPTVEMGCINYCHDMFERYKFAFVFEPLLCQDFITNQFCEVLQHNIIPVVRGVGNYSKFAPRSSFINTEDFESIEELGLYLNYLDTNQKAYAEYLQNKEGLRFNCLSILTRKPAYCDLCKMAHNMNNNRKMIPNVFKWMAGECYEATDIVEHIDFDGQL